MVERVRRRIQRFLRISEDPAFEGPGEFDRVRCERIGGGRVFIGEHSYARGLRVYVGVGRQARIGRFCSIAGDTAILVGGRHALDAVTTSPRLSHLVGNATDDTVGDVVIESDVWIGHGATITPGVCLAVGSVVLAHAVVTRDTEPYEIVGGVPARRLRFRFDEVLRQRLLDSRWWELSDDELRRLAPFVDDPERFLERCQRLS